MREIARWDYKNKDGHVIGHVIRLQNENKNPARSQSRKHIIPHFNPNGQQGIPDGMPAINRVYGQHALINEDKSVYVVEGEKCAFALHELGFQAVTSLSGSCSGHLADWSVLNGLFIA